MARKPTTAIIVPPEILAGTPKEAAAYIDGVARARRGSAEIAKQLDDDIIKEALSLSEIGKQLADMPSNYLSALSEGKPWAVGATGAGLGGILAAAREARRRKKYRNWLNVLLGAGVGGAAGYGGSALLNKVVPAMGEAFADKKPPEADAKPDASPGGSPETPVAAEETPAPGSPSPNPLTIDIPSPGQDPWIAERPEVSELPEQRDDSLTGLPPEIVDAIQGTKPPEQQHEVPTTPHHRATDPEGNEYYTTDENDPNIDMGGESQADLEQRREKKRQSNVPPPPDEPAPEEEDKFVDEPDEGKTSIGAAAPRPEAIPQDVWKKMNKFERWWHAGPLSPKEDHVRAWLVEMHGGNEEDVRDLLRNPDFIILAESLGVEGTMAILYRMTAGRLKGKMGAGEGWGFADALSLVTRTAKRGVGGTAKVLEGVGNTIARNDRAVDRLLGEAYENVQRGRPNTQERLLVEDIQRYANAGGIGGGADPARVASSRGAVERALKTAMSIEKFQALSGTASRGEQLALEYNGSIRRKANLIMSASAEQIGAIHRGLARIPILGRFIQRRRIRQLPAQVAESVKAHAHGVEVGGHIDTGVGHGTPRIDQSAADGRHGVPDPGQTRIVTDVPELDPLIAERLRAARQRGGGVPTSESTPVQYPTQRPVPPPEPVGVPEPAAATDALAEQRAKRRLEVGTDAARADIPEGETPGEQPMSQAQREAARVVERERVQLERVVEHEQAQVERQKAFDEQVAKNQAAAERLRSDLEAETLHQEQARRAQPTVEEQLPSGKPGERVTAEDLAETQRQISIDEIDAAEARPTTDPEARAREQRGEGGGTSKPPERLGPESPVARRKRIARETAAHHKRLQADAKASRTKARGPLRPSRGAGPGSVPRFLGRYGPVAAPLGLHWWMNREY